MTEIKPAAETSHNFSGSSKTRLLLFTQKVDKNDAVLGFMHGWIKKLANEFEAILVICLEKGESDMPKNVEVLSLGKESGESRGKYIINFFRFVWNRRADYDLVLVHMNQEYILLGGLLWQLLSKDIFMWRNHYSGSLATDIAATFCEKVFCTSKYSYTAKYEKTVFMPVGIDTDIFKPNSNEQRSANSILFLARMAPAKRPDLLVEALSELDKRRISFRADFYGGSTSADRNFYEKLKKRIAELKIEDKVRFLDAVPNRSTPDIYSRHEVFVNLSPSGMYDKTLFEAAACGCLVLAASKDFAELVPEKLRLLSDDVSGLADSLEKILAMPANEKSELSEVMKKLAKDQSLELLSRKLSQAMAK